jgi:hypothetical protein
MTPFFRRLQGDGPFNALRTLTLYSFLYCASRWRRCEEVEGREEVAGAQSKGCW